MSPTFPPEHESGDALTRTVGRRLSYNWTPVSTMTYINTTPDSCLRIVQA